MSSTPGSGGTDPADELPPTKIWKYQVHNELGRGACGIVYKGFDPFVRRDVAIKIATPPVDAPEEFLPESTTAQAGHTFFTEARAAGMLHHPHIVALFDAGIEDQRKFLVMEYVEGDTLKPRCKRDAERMPLEQAVDIAFKCAKALDYAHDRGVLHRDIKPGNIMVSTDGVPKIMDFSIAAISTGPETVRGGQVGSPLYMTPEQVRGDPVEPTSDLHALGAVLYHLLTGRPPFVAKERGALFELIRRQDAPRVEILRPDLPAQIGDIVARLLQKRSADRYQSGGEVAVALARFFEWLQAEDRKLARNQSHDSLRQVSFFDAFTDPQVEEILSAGTLARFEPDETIISETEIDNSFYVLVEGVAEVRRGARGFGQLAAGDCFGEIGFLTESRRTASVKAKSRVLAIKLTSALMEQVSNDCQLRFYKVFTETLVARLAQANLQLSGEN